jgi:hypothetical protein
MVSEVKASRRTASRTLFSMTIADRVERQIRTLELIPPGGARDGPRLGRRGLDVPLARCSGSSATRSRRSTSTTACAARSRTRTRDSAGSVLGAESSTAAAGRRRRSCAGSATRSRPTACARPGTPPPTRSRRSSTASWPAAARRDRGEARRRRRAAAAHDHAARRRRPTAATRARVPDRLVERRHEARSHPRARSCRCFASCTPAEQNLLALLEDDDALRDLLARHERRRAPRPRRRQHAVREYDSVWLERSRSDSTAARCAGARGDQRARERA